MWIVLILSLLAGNAWACAKGCTEFEGVCACDAPAEKAPDVQVASDEKPPEDKMPSYEREGIHADMPASAAAKDVLADEAKAKAEAEGKLNAGIK